MPKVVPKRQTIAVNTTHKQCRIASDIDEELDKLRAETEISAFGRPLHSPENRDGVMIAHPRRLFC
jgi:hypothetical protein